MTAPRVSSPVSPGGGSMVGCLFGLSLAVMVAFGTAAALVAGGLWPQINLALRVTAGVGVAAIVAGLVVVPFFPVRGRS